MKCNQCGEETETTYQGKCPRCGFDRGSRAASCSPIYSLLWKLMHDDHGLLLTDDECHQIERAVDAGRKTRQP